MEIAIQTTNKLYQEALKKEYPQVYQNTVATLKKSFKEKIDDTDFVELVDKHFLEKVLLVPLEKKVNKINIFFFCKKLTFFLAYCRSSGYQNIQ